MTCLSMKYKLGELTAHRTDSKLTVNMAPCYWNSVQLALYWTVTIATWGRIEFKKCLSAWCLLCCADSVFECSLKNTVWKGLKHWKAEGNNSKQGCLCAALFLISPFEGLQWSTLCLTSYFRLISFMERAINKRQMSWILFSALEKCYYKSLTLADTGHPGKASLHQVIIILQASIVENNYKTVIRWLLLSKSIVHPEEL